MVKEGDAVVVKCYKCGYKSTPASRTVGPKITTEKTVHVVERTPEYVDRICPKCGTDLNTEQCNCSKKEIDPRLEVLKNFFEK